MKSVHIRNVPPETLGSLKRLAQAHHRSLQGELQAILDRAARMAPPRQKKDRLALITVEVGGESTWTREEIYGTEGR